MSETPSTPSERDQRLERILADYLHAVEAGQPPDRDELLRQHPDLAADLASFFRNRDAMQRLAEPIQQQAPDLPETIGGPEAMSDGVGATLRYFGDYELLEEIARGGMGVVYKARQVSLNRIVAVKMILAGQLASEADVARFRTEAEAAGKLDHPQVVPIYEIGQHEGHHYFSMKLIEGGNLNRLVSAGPMKDAAAAARMMAAIARAVHHAHQRGILHRDLKPGNILIDGQGEPHVTDFGLARRVEGDSGLTQSGAIVGTPSYMAPEQARAQKTLTTAIDVYSLGAILYEMLTGRPPFRGDTPVQTLMQVMESEVPSPRSIRRSVDRDLETICLKCLEKDPDKRYSSAVALADDLERWLRGEPIAARRAGSVERLVKWVRRRPAIAGLIGVAALGLTAAFAVGVFFNLRLKEQVHTAWANQYVAHMNRAENDWESSDITRVLDTLSIYRPENLAAGRRDVRGWEWHLQERLCQQDLRTLKGHKRTVFSVAFSPDGTMVASASLDGTIKLWNTATGQEIRTMEEDRHGRDQIYAVQALAFSPDGKRLATAHEFGDIRLWDTVDGKELRCIKDKQSKVCRSLAFSPDGRYLAGQATYGVQIWNADTGEVVFGKVIMGVGHILLPGERAPSPAGPCVAYSPDGRFLVIAKGNYGEGGVISLHDASDMKQAKKLRSFTGHSNVIMSVAFSNDSKLLATASWDGTVKIWNVADGKELRTLVGHAGAVTSVAFSPDGSRLATAGTDRTVRLWEAGSSKELRIYRGHGNVLLYGHDEGWFEHRVDFQGAVYSVAFSPDGTCLASGSVDGTVKLWDTSLGQQPRIIRDPATERVDDQTPWQLARALSPDGEMVALVNRDGSARLCDAATGQQIRSFQVVEKNDRGEAAVAFSPDSARVATAPGDGTVKIWDTKSGQELLSFKHGSYTLFVAFSPDGTKLATSGGDDKIGELKLWNASDGQELRTIETKFVQAGLLAFSPDWKRLALTGDGGFGLQIWDASTGQKQREFYKNQYMTDEEFRKSDAGNVRCLAFSPDGIHVAMGFTNGQVDLRDCRTGRFVAILQGHAGIVDAVTFSPDGKRVVSGHRNGTVKVWDMTTHQLVRTLKGHKRVVRSLGFCKGGMRLMSAALDGTVRIWDARPLTEVLKSETAAVALLDLLFAKPLPKKAVQSLIRDRLTIDDAVRKQALELAEVYQDEADPMAYYSAAWPLLRHPYSNEFTVEVALAQTHGASMLHGTPEEPRDGGAYKNYFNQDGKVTFIQTTLAGDHMFLGIAHYRMGRFKKEHFQKALDVLNKCQQHRPTVLAFLAMTHYQLGQKSEAQAALTRLREVLKKGEPEQERDGREFLAEAEQLIGR